MSVMKDFVVDLDEDTAIALAKLSMRKSALQPVAGQEVITKRLINYPFLLQSELPLLSC